jgi:hypothetical protein
VYIAESWRETRIKCRTLLNIRIEVVWGARSFREY